MAVFILAACGDPPAAPTGLTVTPGEDSLILNWQDNSNNETGFAIYRKEVASGARAGLDTTQAGGFVNIDSVPANTTTYEDTNVDDNMSYLYGVSAEGSGSDSAFTEPENAEWVSDYQ